MCRRNARPSKEELAISNGVITGMAKEQAFTFLIETVCYVYLLVTHFLHTKGPRLSLTGRRTTSTLIGCLVTLWLLFYTYCIPDWLFKHWFWYITSGFLVVNWILTVCIGWFSVSIKIYFSWIYYIGYLHLLMLSFFICSALSERIVGWVVSFCWWSRQWFK